MLVVVASRDHLLRRCAQQSLRAGFFTSSSAASAQALAQARAAEQAAVPATRTQLMEIEDLFTKWNSTLASGDPTKMSALYAPGAVLLPTLSNVPRNSTEDIEDYFKDFLPKGPQGTINERNVRMINADTAIDSGIYTFAFNNGSKAKARYTYTYRKVDGEWKIAYHHSSLMPQDFATEIRNAFITWAATVKTGTPKDVAALYTPDAVLLPTVSNIARTTPDAVEGYFENFLKLSPQGEVDQDFVTPLGEDAAAYKGIYTFTLKDGSKVPARFSYTFVRRNGKWLIADHHSSAMPEK